MRGHIPRALRDTPTMEDVRRPCLASIGGMRYVRGRIGAGTGGGGLLAARDIIYTSYTHQHR